MNKIINMLIYLWEVWISGKKIKGKYHKWNNWWGGPGKECLLSMVKDKFGNYVVKKIIEFSAPDMRKNIINFSSFCSK